MFGSNSSNTTKKSLNLILLMVVVIVASMAFRTISTHPTATIRDVVYRLEIADSQEEQAQGLSDRESLDADVGMLFVYGQTGYYSHWMKDMLIDLDMIWINDHGVIVDMEQNVSPDSFPKAFVSDIPADYVLEINAGQAEVYGFDIGDRVELSNIDS